MNVPDRLLRLDEVAELLCVGKNTVRRYLDDPAVPLRAVKLGSGKRPRIRVCPDSVRDLLRMYGHGV